MPIYHRVEQRSPSWFALRIGKPTASEFHKVITPKTGQLSAQSTDYAHSILAELMLGRPLESPETEWMVRGQELEDNAVEAYEFETGRETSLGGFIDNGYRVGISVECSTCHRTKAPHGRSVSIETYSSYCNRECPGYHEKPEPGDLFPGETEDQFGYQIGPHAVEVVAGTYGCSPDRLVGDDGILEMKCPAPNTHVGYLLDRTSLEMGKRVQVQGQLLVTGRAWCDLVAYHPEMPLVVVRVKRDEAFIEKMETALCTFVQQLALMREKLEREFGPFKPITFDKPAPVDDSLGVSDQDATRIWEASQV